MSPNSSNKNTANKKPSNKRKSTSKASVKVAKEKPALSTTRDSKRGAVDVSDLKTRDAVLTPHTLRVVAVIDIGATSIRMAIAQVDIDGKIENLESLSQAVSLGKDSFIDGKINSKTIEECVRVLKIYRAKLVEYHITREKDIHVVATSAVREASNRLALLDRIYIATGFEIEPFDEAELHRVTYLGIQPLLKNNPSFRQQANIFCEIGGGSTEILVVEDGNVVFSETYRMGSLRLRKTLEAFHAPISEERSIMCGQINNVIQRFKRSLPKLTDVNFVGMGGDLRFAISEMKVKSSSGYGLGRVDLERFEKFTESIIRLTPDQLFNKYDLSFPEAESLGPALLANLSLIKSLDVSEFYVSSVNMREGLVREMIHPQVWNQEFRDQVIRYSVELGRNYQFDEEFAVNVAALAHSLFSELQSEHELDSKFALILNVAALLHEIGQFVNHRGFHKHTLYLIRNSDFFGLGQKDVLLAALVARYHRRAHPQPNHEGYSSLGRKDRVAVSKLAAILRLAIAINISRQNYFDAVNCDIGDEIINIRLPKKDLSMESLALNQFGLLFQETFGKRISVSEE